MKRSLIVLSLFCMSGILAAQELPKLKPLSEKEMQEKLIPSQKKDNKWGYANEKENFRIKAIFDMADPFVPTVVQGRDTVISARVSYAGKYGFLARTGVFLYNPEFDFLSEFDRGVSVFRRNGVAGFLSASGRILADGLEDMKLFDGNGMAWFRKDGCWGAYDLEGNVVIANVYDKIPDVMYGALAQTEKKGKLGLALYRERRTVLDADCDQIGLDENDRNLIICRKGGLVGCFHVDGRQMFPMEYELITGTEGGRIIVKKDGKYGLYDNMGVELIAPSMSVNQIAESHAFYQIFDESRGRQELKVYYKDRLMDAGDFDDALFQDISRERYGEKVESRFERFPQWMKKHIPELIPARQYKAQWRYDKTYYPAMFSSDSSDGHAFVTVGKDMKVISCAGFVLPENKAVNRAVIGVDSLSIACGSWLQSLMASVNGGKIMAYDKAMGTNVFRQWKTLSAVVRNAFLTSDGDAVLMTDIMIDDLLMQRVMTRFTPGGAQKYSIKLDGVLYNQEDYVASEESGCFATEDMIIISYIRGKNNDKVTKFYSADGKLQTEIDDFYAEILLESAPSIKFFGQSGTSYGTCSVDWANRSFSRLSLEQDPQKVICRIAEGTAHFINRETMLLDAVFEVTSRHMPVLALRCAASVWDGQTIVGVSPNHWDKAEDIRWTYIPRVKSGTYSENINGYMLNVYPVGDDDIAVYGIYPDVWMKEGIRYGYIGYDGTFFTQAYFEEAKPFADGVAQVKIGGEWKQLRKEDFVKYMTDPQGAFSPANYELGTTVFTMEHIAKSMSGSGNEVTEDGFWLMRGNGAELIPYLNTFTGRYGFADSVGKMVTAPVYDSFYSASSAVDGLIPVRINDATGDQNSGWGFIDMKGELVIPCEYYAQWPADAPALFTEGDRGVCVIARLMPDGRKVMGCINKKGEVLIPFEYDEIFGPVNNILTAKVGGEEKQFMLY